MRKPGSGRGLFAGATIAAALCALATTAPAQSRALPGGASSLNEVHGDWTVRCRVTAKDGAQTTACAMSQQQSDRKTRRLALEISLVPLAQGGARGVIVMPFGLSVTKPIQLSVKDRPIGKPRWFSTCIPAGCLVPLDLSAAAIKAVSDGAKLRIEATAGDGRPFRVDAPLKGFASAYGRTADLLK
ncbi:invasion protein [Allgaiera indica]|uniref:Invasion protein n=1 Tax=Allgaiera indica TaxID=765699 RepID=A0AAN4UUG2_9RHOB|nr:invasion associated locus B family protein [Allgaiera indica]GHE05534.1 invasion protein [Allgaiera indica]SDX69827.1 Invasion protein IalB, involved in pathogenesis [Allgaiera indica]